MWAAATPSSAPKRRRPACTWTPGCAAGIRHFRLEFVHESAEQVTRVTRAFEDALAGRTQHARTQRAAARIAPQGVTEGSLFVPEGYLTLPVLQ